MSEWIISAEDIDDIIGGRFIIGQKLVRCGECSHSEVCKMDDGDVRYCHIFEMQTEDDYYCADGESLEEDDLPTSANHDEERLEDDGVEKLAEMLGVLKHGKWLKRNNENYSPFDPCSSENICICNQCGYETDFETNYCANCGAKMDGERREE